AGLSRLSAPSCTNCITRYANARLVNDGALLTESTVSGKCFSLSRIPYAFRYAISPSTRIATPTPVTSPAASCNRGIDLRRCDRAPIQPPDAGCVGLCVFRDDRLGKWRDPRDADSQQSGGRYGRN